MTLDAALAAAVPDNAGVPWCARYAAGLVLVELDAGTREQRSRRVVTKVPAGLTWQPVTA